MKKIDLTSPVEVWACELPAKDYAACTLTLFNLSRDQVTSVEVTLTLMDEAGDEIARVIHRARGLNGAPGSSFAMTVPADGVTRAKSWEALVNKVWFDNSSIWRHGKDALTEYEPNQLPPSNALNHLQLVAGNDAVGYPAQRDGLWLCVCGRPNPDDAGVCARCGRTRTQVFNEYGEAAVEAAVQARESQLDAQGRKALADNSERQLEREKAFERSRRKHRRAVAAVAAVVIVAAGGYAVARYGLPYQRYRQAVAAFNEGNYEQAEATFLALDAYGDSADYVLRCRYETAKAQLAQGDAGSLASARSAFAALGDYSDAAAQVTECDYRQALLLLDAGDRDGAAVILSTLDGYQDSADRLLNIDYQNAADLLTAGDYAGAREAFGLLGAFSDAAEQVKEAWYQEAAKALADGETDAALTALAEIPDYKDASVLSQQAHYARGSALRAAGEIDSAAEEFALAGDYEDAADQANECFYAPAAEAMANGQYNRAATLFGKIPGYLDASDQWTKATYLDAKDAMSDLEYKRATTLLSSLPADYEDVADLLRECVYQPALTAYNEGKYEDALAQFTSLADYRDAAEQVNRCNYAIADNLYAEGDLDGAAAMYEALGDFSDAADKLNAVHYDQAAAAAALGTAEGFQQAIDLYTALGNYSDSANLLKAAQFQQAELTLAGGDWEAARAAFVALGKYGTAAERVTACDYAHAEALLAEGGADEAAALFLSLGDYQDAAARAQAIRYDQGVAASQSGKLIDAAHYFEQAGDYQDAAQQAESLYEAYFAEPAAQAQEAFDRNDFAGCVARLRSVDRTYLPEKYKNLTALYQEACFQAGNQLYEAGEPYAALNYYRDIPDYRNVDARLQRACYLILGGWIDMNGVVYIFREDGTMSIGEETMYFAVDGTTLRTGPAPGMLSDTHRLSGLTRRNAWLFDGRSGTEVTVYLTRDEELTAALSGEGEIPLPGDD